MKLSTIDVRAAASAADLIFEALREAIFTGELKAGEHLRQDALADMFNTSRIPVREALSRLEQQGLVKTERFRGTTVSSLSADEVQEIFEFRALLEGEVIRHAVKNMDDATLAIAKKHCDAFSNETDSAKYGELNRIFHYALYERANRPYHLHVVKTTLDRIESYLRAQLVLTDGMSRARREHIGILEACVERNADLASKLTQEHILGASESLINYLKDKEAK
ncbi:GntR family transcriptional regulator [Maritalea porphyrae]|mgnify:CR=1 FL=1|uniref:GntR family transcriptional regulator n=1 Tax=Maritalea porphyrae TaxID=880732 RepID=UPI0022AF5FAF|nr:GntR family transcriptional regulator [Maritalea porphyrae]MCZ4271090.1 GntR family transcriptional regulator [Maritalea porphyrae]